METSRSASGLVVESGSSLRDHRRREGGGDDGLARGSGHRARQGEGERHGCGEHQRDETTNENLSIGRIGLIPTQHGSGNRLRAGSGRRAGSTTAWHRQVASHPPWSSASPGPHAVVECLAGSLSVVECLARDERGVSRPASGGLGLDTLAGARYSTNESVATRGSVGGRVPREGRARCIETRFGRTRSRYARWRSLLDQRSVGGRVPREGRARCIETRFRWARSRYARCSTNDLSVVECLARDERGVSRPASGELGLDTLAGARYSTNEPSALATRPTILRSLLALCRWSSASRGTSEVYRDPLPEDSVSIRSLALATRPTNVGARYSTNDLSVVECLARDERGVSRPASGGLGLDTLAGARYSTNEESVVECLAGSLSVVECLARDERGVSRPASGGLGLDTLAGARYSTNELSVVECLAGSLSVVECLARDERGVSRPASGELGLDTLAGARYSTNEPSALATRPTICRWSSASRGTSEVYRDPLPEDSVSIRSLALATRPTNTRSLLDQRGVGGRVPRGGRARRIETRFGRTRSRYARWRSLLDQRGVGGRVPRGLPVGGRVPREGRARCIETRFGRTRSRYARWRSLLDQRAVGGRVPRGLPVGGRVPREGRARCIETRLGRTRSRYARWRSLLDQRSVGARYSTNDLSVVECLARDERGVSRPASGGLGLDTLAGARYSTNEYALATRPTNTRSLLDQRDIGG